MLPRCIDLPQVVDQWRSADIRRVFLQHFAIADDGVQRRPQLVRHVGEEPGLVGARLHELLVTLLEQRQHVRQLGRRHFQHGVEFDLLGLLRGERVVEIADRRVHQAVDDHDVHHEEEDSRRRG